MTFGHIVVLLLAALLMLIGGTVAFGQRAPSHGDAPPSYYRRMIVGVMVAAFGLIVSVFVISWAVWTA